MEVFNLDIIPGKAMPVIHCSQFDKGRAYRANLFERGAVYILNGAETLSIIEKKSDGNMVTISVTNTSDSFIEFEITEQMSAIAGPQLCELRIEEGGNVIGSLNFALDCEASPDTGIESDSAIHNLEEQIGEAVADQYAAEDVVFDNTPTAGHGVGFAVTSEGVLNAIPTELDDLDDVNISGAAQGEALVWNGAEWVNGTVSTVGSIDDLNDVDTTGKANADSLRYNATAQEWEAKPTTVEMTLAEYEALGGDYSGYENTNIIITDAPNLNATAQDISYEGGADTVWDKVEGNKSDITDLNTNKADKSALTWTLLGETTGTAEQNLPATWNELQVYGMFGGNAQYGFTAHAIKAHWGANPTKYIEGGADKDSGTDHHIAIWHIGSNAKIGLDFWRYNNTDYTSTSKLIVYYR